jgi:anti-sigma regulatory factor (Ser/Thr protein kinase)
MSGGVGTVSGAPFRPRGSSGGGPAFHPWLRVAAIDLPAVPEAAQEARALVRAAMPRWGLPGLAADTALVTSELVTNAVRESAPLPGQPGVRVRLTALPLCVLIGVHDAAPGIPAARPAGPDADGGRGLVLVDALAARWGVRRVQGGGKIVWAVLVT